MEEYCFVCNEIMDGSFKVDLTIMTSYSEKPIYQIIEAFTDTSIDLEQTADAVVCQSCVLKFNEYDELVCRAETIQLDLTQLLTEPRHYAVDEEEGQIEEFREEVLVKNEEAGDDDDGIAFEPIYFEEGTDEIDDYQMEVVVDDSIENLGESSQMASRNGLKAALSSTFNQKIVKHEDHDFVVIELENNQRAYMCDICSKTFKDKSKLKSHREIHTTERNVICKECGKTFKTMNCLRNHKRMHLPVRTYFGCDRCDKKYTQKIQLKKHIEIVHMNRRDFVCTTCGASFGTKSVLKMHMLSHTEHRNEECTICGFRVHTKAKLRRHMKSHTGERDYECGICNKKFLYSYNVIAHVRNVHEKHKIQEYQQAIGEVEEGLIEYSYDEEV